MNNQEKKQRAGAKNEAKKIKNNNFTGINREKSNIAIAILENCHLINYFLFWRHQ